jgi:hypothetical protein
LARPLEAGAQRQNNRTQVVAPANTANKDGFKYSGLRTADDLSEFLQSGALPLGNVRSIR